MSCSIGFIIARPSTPPPKPSATNTISDVRNAVLTSRSFFAPKYCAVTTEVPTANPIPAIVTIFMMTPLVPTAASASLLIKLPTTTVSTRL